MSDNSEWTQRRRQVATMVVDGYARKEIASSLDISLSTVRREVEALVALTGAKTANKLPMILQSEFPEKLIAKPATEEAFFARGAVRKNRQNILFATLIFALVVTGYGMHLLITAQDLWSLQGVSRSLIETLHYLTIIALGVALILFGGKPERECGLVWVGYFLLDNFILDRFVGQPPGPEMQAWRTIYVEWFLGNLFFLIGFSIVYFRHRLYYIRLLILAQLFSIAVHASQGAFGFLPPFVYAATIVIAYYFLWVILSVGLVIAFNRVSPRSPRT